MLIQVVFKAKETIVLKTLETYEYDHSQHQTMKTLFNQPDTTELLNRIDSLSQDSKNLWGKMNVCQMLAHCAAGIDMAAGRNNPARAFIGKLLGKLARPVYSSEKPFVKNSPTDKSLMKLEANDFEMEKENLKKILQEFTNAGAEKCTTHPHPFFGKITTEEWGIGTYKHIDHHLRQFGA